MPLYIKYRLRGVGPNVKLRVLEKQSGLIGARLAGAEWSTSDIIVFLDAHCEATIGWLEPMAQKIKDNPKAIVIPSIDGIDDRTIAFHGSVVSFENLHLSFYYYSCNCRIMSVYYTFINSKAQNL